METKDILEVLTSLKQIEYEHLINGDDLLKDTKKIRGLIKELKKRKD